LFVSLGRVISLLPTSYKKRLSARPSCEAQIELHSSTDLISSRKLLFTHPRNPPDPSPALSFPLPEFGRSPPLLLSLLSALPLPTPQLPAGLRARADLTRRRQRRAERQRRRFLGVEDLLAASCSAQTTSWRQLLGARSSTSWRRRAARGGGTQLVAVARGAWRLITPAAVAILAGSGSGG
jgi:hypothetical protein